MAARAELNLDRSKLNVADLRPEAKFIHFEPLRASVRAGRQLITRESGPHASALRLKIYKVSAIGQNLKSQSMLMAIIVFQQTRLLFAVDQSD